VVVIVAGLFAATAAMMSTGIRQELTPPEDRAVALLSVSAPQGVSLDYTTSKMREIEALIEPLRASGEITNVFSITGFGSNSRGFMVMTLAEWDARERSQQEIVGQINGALRSVVGVRAFAIQPNSLGIRGAGRGLTFAITGNDYGQLEEVANALVERMQENPAFGQVRLEYETTQPQLFIEIDRTRASDLGIEIAGLGEALRAVLEGAASAASSSTTRATTSSFCRPRTRSTIRRPGERLRAGGRRADDPDVDLRAAGGTSGGPGT
jgi:HAE1 family hydrophobic/amphiphilic exporter-1